MSPIPIQQRASEARKRLKAFTRLLASCRLCPRECGSRRLKAEFGECGLGPELRVMSSHLHPGEEPVISGTRGSGTVFFSGCNLACLFCQNYDISHEQMGREITPKELGKRMVELQYLGAHNINLVTPTPQIVRIMEALAVAWEAGLSIPIVYNCGGYESFETLALLDGLIDIYMPDMKYGEDSLGRVSGISDYTTRSTVALKEMGRQVGTLRVDDDGIAVQGMIVRHLVLPNDRSGTEKVLRWLAQEIGPEVTVSLMSQYHPLYRAEEAPGLDRRLTRTEYTHALELLEDLGLENGWVQEEPE